MIVTPNHGLVLQQDFKEQQPSAKLTLQLMRLAIASGHVGVPIAGQTELRKMQVAQGVNASTVANLVGRALQVNS